MKFLGKLIKIISAVGGGIVATGLVIMSIIDTYCCCVNGIDWSQIIECVAWCFLGVPLLVGIGTTILYTIGTALCEKADRDKLNEELFVLHNKMNLDKKEKR